MTRVLRHGSAGANRAPRGIGPQFKLRSRLLLAAAVALITNEVAAAPATASSELKPGGLISAKRALEQAEIKARDKVLAAICTTPEYKAYSDAARTLDAILAIDDSKSVQAAFVLKAQASAFKLQVPEAAPPRDLASLATAADAAKPKPEDVDAFLKAFRSARDQVKGEVEKALDKASLALMALAGKRWVEHSKLPPTEGRNRDLIRACASYPRPADRGTELAKTAVLAGAGVSWQTNLIEGTARFLGQRAESELKLWLITQFRSDVCGETSASAPYFEATCRALTYLSDSNLDRFPGTVMSAALREDLERLPLRIAVAGSNLDESVAAPLFSLLPKTRSGVSPLTLLAGLQKARGITDACAKGNALACALRDAGYVVSLLGDVLEVKPDEFEKQLDDLARTLQSLLVERCFSSAALCKLPVVPADARKSAAEKPAPRKPASRAEGHADEADTPEPADERVVELLRAAYALRRAIDAFADRADASLNDAAPVVDRTIDVLDAAMLVVRTQPPGWNDQRSALRAMGQMMIGRYAEGTRELLPIIERKRSAVPNAVWRFLPMAVDVAKATDAPSVEAALDSASTPVGSWRIKREQVIWTVSAMVGALGGGEQPINAPGRTGSAFGSAMAALGVDVAGPIGKGWVFGGFVSAVDVGQLLSAPLGPDESTHDKVVYKARAGGEIQIVQVLSPGLYVRLGVGKSPVTVGFGASVAPRLRTYSSRSEATPQQDLGDSQVTMIRYGIFIGIDNTLIPF
jgi:hypothetical protein